MLTQDRENLIKSAEEIRNKIRGGKLYGYVIDENDADMMLIAAYLCGELHGQNRDWIYIEEILEK